MERELPTGTVTFLFTDMEGATRLLEELGSGYQDILVQHHRLLREVFERHGGVEVDTQGDAFFVSFPSALAAVRAAADAQRALADTQVRVRIGLHSGEAAVSETGYVGADVHRAARISSAAHGGQVLLSQATRELVEDDLPDELGLRDLGEHRLKDLTRPQRLHQLLIDGLRAEFPALRTLEQRPTNLPVQRTALIGRERELAEIFNLLSQTRLLTLTGPGGTGKTRLALQLAADVLDHYDGVFLVDLANIDDPGLVVSAVGQTLGIKEGGGRPLSEALVEYFAGKRMLLVLDNMEHVVEAAPELSACLASSPDSKLLTTSRTALRLSDEQEYPVPPLGAPAAVELFAERARAVKPEFVLNGDREVVAEICVRVDALPLAIELAAARVKLLPPRKLLERLEQRLPLLTGGARDAPERHRTLRATIDWSFELLDEQERKLFRRLSVFAGGCTLEAAEAVCDATLDGIASLVDNSLLAEREGAAGEPRFVMLEIVREYARERLELDEELDELRRRHAAHFLALAEEAGAGLDEDRLEWLDRLEDDHDNVRGALAWLRESGEVERELRLGLAVAEFRWIRGYLSEQHRWLADTLAKMDGLDPGLRADALAGLAFCAWFLGDFEQWRRSAEESLALGRSLDDNARVEWALRLLSFDSSDPNESERLLRECEALARELGDEGRLAWIQHVRGAMAVEEADYVRARTLMEEALAINQRLGYRFRTANSLVELGLLAALDERYGDARLLLSEALRTSLELGAKNLTGDLFDGLAAVALSKGEAERATQLLGAADMVRQATMNEIEAHFRPLRTRTETGACEFLRDRFELERGMGRALTLDDAAALALGDQ